MKDSTLEESDSSGLCTVTYKKVDTYSISKKKFNCYRSRNNLRDTVSSLIY